MRLPAIVFASLTMLWSCASAPQPMFPSELADEGEAYQELDPVSVWSEESRQTYSSRVRLTLGAGLLRQKVSIRIDTPVNGQPTGRVAWSRPDRSDRNAITTRTFTPNSAQIRKLDDLIAQNVIWQDTVEHWVVAQNPSGGFDYVCIDGVNVILERTTAAGYRFSQAIVQCAAPPAFIDIAAEIIDIANLGTTEVATWLQ